MRKTEKDYEEVKGTKCFKCKGPVERIQKWTSRWFSNVAVKETVTQCIDKKCGEGTIWGVHGIANEYRLALLLLHEKKEHFPKSEFKFIRTMLGIGKDEYKKLVEECESWKAEK